MPRLIELTISEKEERITAKYLTEYCRFDTLSNYIEGLSKEFNLEFKPLDDLYIFGKKIAGITFKNGIFPVEYSDAFYARKGDKIYMLSPDMTPAPLDVDAYLLCELEEGGAIPSEERDIIHFINN